MLNLVFLAVPAYAHDAVPIFEILRQAYPEKASEVRYRNGDWSIRINDTVIYWTNGRLLPDEDRGLEQEFAPYQFYRYPRSMPPILQLTPSERNYLQEIINRRESQKLARHTGFPEALWGMGNLDEAEKTVKSIAFLGKKTRIHPDIIDKLSLVEEEVMEAAKWNPEVNSWIDQLRSVDAFVWRKIAGTMNRSLHSYGISLDLIPKNYGGKNVYWRWSMVHDLEWWSIPYSERYFPPESVIKAFEQNGFIWGGKWFFFDQIHFEYRPELMNKNLLDDESQVDRLRH